MSSLQTYTAYGILPAISGIGVYGTTILARNAGLFDSIIQDLRKRPAQLSGSKNLLIRKWTYIRPVDNLLGFLINFFWPVTDGKNETVTLQSRHFIGQLVAMWSIIELEGARAGDVGGLSSQYVYLSLFSLFTYLLVGST
jgi:hypothetical protein